MRKGKKKIGRSLPKFAPKASRSTSINPYFRDKFQFKGKKVYFSKEFATEKSRERSRLLSLPVQAIGKLKPKKDDRGKLVFVRVSVVKKKGKTIAKITRVKGRSLLTAPVYVLKGAKKKFRILNPYDPRTLAKGVKARPFPQRLDSLDVRRLRKRRVDIMQFLDKTSKIFKRRMITRPLTPAVLRSLKTSSRFDEKEEQRYYRVKTPGGELGPFYKAIIAVWARLAQGQRKQMKYQPKGSITLCNGKVIPFDSQPFDTSRFFELTSKGLSRAVGKTKASRRVYSTPFMLDLYSRYVHSGIAGALASEGLFTQSSVRRIASRPYNYGKKRKDWQTIATDGSKMAWPGIQKQPTEICSIEFTLKPLF